MKSIDGPPITEEELQARGKSDLVIKFIALLQIIWFAVQTLFRGIQHYQITALEIMTVAFVVCAVFTYSVCWYQPQDVEFPVVLEIRNVAPATDGTTPDQNRDRSSQAEEAAFDVYVPGWAAENSAVILLGFFACGFGALHCLAWNSPFPTYKEKLAWRVCSVTTTVIPALYISLVVLQERYKPSNMVKRYKLSDMVEANFYWVYLLMLVSYVLGRATIIVLAFTTLRSLPADAFQTVNWNDYLPHFAG